MIYFLSESTTTTPTSTFTTTSLHLRTICDKRKQQRKQPRNNHSNLYRRRYSLIALLRTVLIALVGVMSYAFLGIAVWNIALSAAAYRAHELPAYDQNLPSTPKVSKGPPHAKSASNINFRLQPELFVDEFILCLNMENCRFYYFHFGKSGGTDLIISMEDNYPFGLQGCCQQAMMERFEKAPHKYCLAKFSAYEISSNDFLGHVMPTCYNLTSFDRSIVLVTYREPIQQTLSVIHQWCNKHRANRSNGIKGLCERCSYSRDKKYWSRLVQRTNNHYHELYRVVTSTLRSDVLVVDMLDLSDLYQALHSATNFTAFSVRGKANRESVSFCNFGFSSEMMRGLAPAELVYRNLTLGI